MPDNVRDCNQFDVSVTEFERIWCVRCQNKDCVRARAGNAWTNRIKTQKDLLFNPPRADPKDPLYQSIVSKDFKCLNPQDKDSAIINVDIPVRFVSNINGSVTKEGK
jgi:hypothetical protein